MHAVAPVPGVTLKMTFWPELFRPLVIHSLSPLPFSEARNNRGKSEFFKVAAVPPKVAINWMWRTTTLVFICECPVYSSLFLLQRLISFDVKPLFVPWLIVVWLIFSSFPITSLHKQGIWGSSGQSQKPKCSQLRLWSLWRPLTNKDDYIHGHQQWRRENVTRHCGWNLSVHFKVSRLFTLPTLCWVRCTFCTRSL